MGERLEATEEERGDKREKAQQININKFALSCEICYKYIFGSIMK